MLIVWLYDIIGLEKPSFRYPIVNDKLALLKLSSLGTVCENLCFMESRRRYVPVDGKLKRRKISVFNLNTRILENVGPRKSVFTAL